MKRRLFVLLGFSFLTGNALAQGVLDTVTVSNSYAIEPLFATGRNITIIRGEQFAMQPVHSIDELLRYLPGIEIQQRAVAGSQSDIVIRGGTFQQVLVVLDGIRLNDPNTGHFNAYIPISPAEVDRIEILKGASSAIYGSEAVGGVIHIITKTFANRCRGVSHSGKELMAQGAMGEFGLVTSNIGGSYCSGKTTVSGGLLTARSNGEPQRGMRGYFDNKTISASVGHVLQNGLSILLRSAYDDRQFGAQNFYTTFLSDTASEQVKTFWNQVRIHYKKGSSSLSLDAGYKKVNDLFQFTPRSTANSNKSELLQLLALYQMELKRGDLLVIGTQWLNKKIQSNDRGGHQLNNLAQFISYTNVWRRLSVNPSFRIEFVDKDKHELVPQLNLSYRLREFQFRASGGKTIRDADFTERYNNFNKTIVTGGRIGNPWLRAERSWSYEVGADYFMVNNMKLSTSFFKRYHQKLIDWTPTSYDQMPRQVNLVPTGNYALAKNIARVTTTGLELDVQFIKQLSARQSIFATLGLVWLNSKSSDTIPSFYISSHAKFLANFNLQYSIDRFTISINGVYKHRQPQMAVGMKKIPSNCVMVNGKLEARAFDSFFIFVEVDNIGDVGCSDLLGAQLPGRWMSGGIKVSLQ